MPFVPQPSRSCGILGSTNHAPATFLDKFWVFLFLARYCLKWTHLWLQLIFIKSQYPRSRESVGSEHNSLEPGNWIMEHSFATSCRICLPRVRAQQTKQILCENNTSFWQLFLKPHIKVEKKSHMVESVGSMLLPGAACVSQWQPVQPFAPAEVSVYKPFSMCQSLSLCFCQYRRKKYQLSSVMLWENQHYATFTAFMFLVVCLCCDGN